MAGPSLIPLLAVSAGLIILVSMVPDIISNFRNPTRAKGQDWRRPALQICGYIMWVSYGALNHDPYLTTVTGTALCLSVILFLQARRARSMPAVKA